MSVDAHNLDGGHLGLGLGLGLGMAQPQSQQQQQQQLEQQQAPNTPALERILADNHEGEFARTESVIGAVDAMLQRFAQEQALDRGSLEQGHGLSQWLQRAAGGQPSGPMSAVMAAELDYVYAMFWAKFVPTIRTIIAERPNGNLVLTDLAYRCELRRTELGELAAMASKSAMFRVLLDIFNAELYKHCLRRKLAILRLRRVEPSPIVRRLVDVYLELPLELQAKHGADLFKLADEQAANRVYQVYCERGQAFNLANAINRFGPLASAVPLAMESMSSAGDEPSQYASKFKDECAHYTGLVSQFWTDFDQVAAGLSSESNNLTELNARIKFVEPHLVYASVCNQLAQTV